MAKTRWLGCATLLAALGVGCNDPENSTGAIRVENGGSSQAGSGGNAGSSSGAGGSAAGAQSAGAGAGGEGEPGGGAGASGQGGLAGSAGSSGGSGVAGASGNAGQAGAGASGCEVGAAQSKTVGPEGATLSLCGARLTAAPETIEAPGIVLGIEVVQPPAPAPFEREFLGPVFRFTPDGSALKEAVTLGLARDPSAQGIVDLAFYSAQEGGWITLEPCPVEGELSTKASLLGTYALLRDVNTYPPSTTGLGEGSIEGTFDGASFSMGVDEGYAIYEQGGPQDRSLTLVFRKVTGDTLDNLDIRYKLTDGAPPELLQVSWISTSDLLGGWGYLEPVDGPISSFTLSEPTKDSFEGSITVDLRRGDETRAFKATFKATAEKFRYPGEASCLPEG